MSLIKIIERIESLLLDGSSFAEVRPHFLTLRDQFEALEHRPKIRNNKPATEQLKKANETISRLKREIKLGNESVKKEMLAFEAKYFQENEAIKHENARLIEARIRG